MCSFSFSPVPILTMRKNLMVHSCQCDVLKGTAAIISRQCSHGTPTMDDLRNRLLFPGQAPDSFLRTLSRNIGLGATGGKGCLRVVEAAISTALTGHTYPVQQHYYHLGLPKVSPPISPFNEVVPEHDAAIGFNELALNSKQ